MQNSIAGCKVYKLLEAELLNRYGKYHLYILKTSVLKLALELES